MGGLPWAPPERDDREGACREIKKKITKARRGTESSSGEGQELSAWLGSLSPGGATACYAQFGGDTAAGLGATRAP